MKNLSTKVDTEKILKLEDTIPFMDSEDWKLRLIAECLQATIRCATSSLVLTTKGKTFTKDVVKGLRNTTQDNYNLSKHCIDRLNIAYSRHDMQEIINAYITKSISTFNMLVLLGYTYEDYCEFCSPNNRPYGYSFPSWSNEEQFIVVRNKEIPLNRYMKLHKSKRC